MIQVESNKPYIPISVQEPPDVPSWVITLEINYHHLIDAIKASNKAFYDVGHVVRSIYPGVGSLAGCSENGDQYANAVIFASTVYARIGEELSLDGVKAEIPAVEMPESILTSKVGQFKDAHAFSPIKLYQYLIDRYGGKAKDMIRASVAAKFVNIFGHGRWSFVGTEHRPLWKNFLADSMKINKDFITGYDSCSVGDSWRAQPGFIDWNNSGCNSAKAIFRYLTDLFSLILDEDDRETLNNVLAGAHAMAENCGDGKTIAMGETCGSDRLRFTFRKDKLEVRFSKILFEKITTFVLDNQPQLKG